MALYDGPRDKLAGNLNLIVDNFRSERTEYWEDEPETAHLVFMCDLMAEALVASSSDLVFEDDEEPWKKRRAPWAEVTRLAEEHGFAEHLAQSVEIVLADDFVNRLVDAPGRCLSLARYVLSDPPSPNVQRYLKRLGRCYVAGFLQECVILCRAVLENAVRDLTTPEERAQTRTFREAKTMRQRLTAAYAAGLISERTRRDAEVVWHRGNTAVHDDPEATKDVFGTIQLTMRALEDIYAAS